MPLFLCPGTPSEQAADPGANDPDSTGRRRAASAIRPPAQPSQTTGVPRPGACLGRDAMLERRTLLAATAAAIAAPARAMAQGAWPERPVRVVVPWPPGGSTDVLARLLAERLSQSLGQPFVVENKPGAGGNIGTDAIAKGGAGRLHHGAGHGRRLVHQPVPLRAPALRPRARHRPRLHALGAAERLRRSGAARAGAHAAGVHRLGEAAARRRELRQPGRRHHAAPLGRHVRRPRRGSTPPTCRSAARRRPSRRCCPGTSSSPSTTSPATSR